MRKYVVGLMFIVGCWLPGVQPYAEAQTQRDRFVVVTAKELGENPQRYWSRGIVFEDELIRVTGRGKRVKGRRMVQIETATLGQCYVDDRIIDRMNALTERQNYLFAGTVLSESRRRFLLFSPRSHYFVTIDAVEELADDIEDDLLKAFIDAEPDRAAFQNVQKAIVQAQNQLVAFAQAEEVEISTLFDSAGETMDKAAEVSRVAVRAVEQELGITSIEMLSLLVRELLAAQYVGAVESPVAPQVPEPEDAEPGREEPETEDADEGQSVSAEEALDDEEAASSRGLRFWRSREAEGTEEVTDSESESAPVLEEPSEDEPAARSGWFRRRAMEPETESDPGEPAMSVADEPEEEPRTSRLSRFRRASLPEEAVVPAEMEPITEAAPPPEREIRRRRSEVSETPPREAPRDREGPFVPVGR